MMLRTAAFALLACASSALGLVHAVDSSGPVSTSDFIKAKGDGFTKAVIRGYFEACSVGGRVDPNFATVYNNARAAGITNIDTYWSPCTGSRNKCKPFATQIAELVAIIDANSMNIGTIWVDIERNRDCNTWDWGASFNLNKAKEMVAAMKASGQNFGIYSTPAQWASIFGTADVVLDASYPLWYATFNNDESLTFDRKFGGWTSCVGHQYTDQSASKFFNLNVFAN